MGLIMIDLDITNLPLEDFMKAMGYGPVNRNGNLLTYESPYSANGNIVVDTEANGWHDKAQPDKLYGAIYDLAYEITGSANKSELNLFIASQMKKVREVKMYDVTANGGLGKPEKEPERPQRKRGMRL